LATVDQTRANPLVNPTYEQLCVRPN